MCYNKDVEDRMVALRTCDICGKKFLPGVQHRFKMLWRRRTYIFCSYPCFHEAEIRKENKTLEKEKTMIQKNRLKELRDRSRLTINEVSTLTGFSPSAISRHENENRGLTEVAINKYAALYKVPTHQLFIEPVKDDDNGNEGNI